MFKQKFQTKQNTFYTQHSFSTSLMDLEIIKQAELFSSRTAGPILIKCYTGGPCTNFPSSCLSVRSPIYDQLLVPNHRTDFFKIRYEDSLEVQIVVFCIMTTCSLVGGYWHYGETCCLWHLRTRLQMSQPTRPQSENLKPYITKSVRAILFFSHIDQQ
jgi:hypothetical protein